MRRKVIKMKVRSAAEYTRLMAKLYTPHLTDTEVEVLSAFVDAHLLLKKRGIKIGTFSTPVRKKVAERLKRDHYTSINGYIKNLKDKGVLRKSDVPGGYVIHPLFLPGGESEIVLKLTKSAPQKDESQG